METGISSGLMGHLARMQTLPFLQNGAGQTKLKLFKDFIPKQNNKLIKNY